MVKRNSKLVAYFNQQSGHCAYCDVKMTLDLGYSHTATIDHVVPVSAFGEKTAFNEVAACSDCNTIKADMPPAVFLRFRLGLARQNSLFEVG